MLDYRPCPECEKKLRSGVALIGCVETQPDDGRPELAEKAYPTGRYVVLQKDDAKALLEGALPEETVERILKTKLALMPDDFIKEIIAAASQTAAKTGAAGPADI